MSNHLNPLKVGSTDPEKTNASERIEHYATAEEMQRATSAGADPVMRSKIDDLSVWQAVKQYRLVSMLAMAAAFCASLDGYRKSTVGTVANVTVC